MNKNELLAGTEADKRTTADSIPSASLVQNGLLGEGYEVVQKDDGRFTIIGYGQIFNAGYDRSKAENAVKLLNETHRPNVIQSGEDGILACFNFHDKGEKCNYEKVL